jgi:hypothetical protein
MRRVVSLVSALVLSVGCSGGSPGTSGSPEDGEGGSSGGGQSGDTPSVTPASDCPVDDELLPARAVRLTATQYERSLKAAFGVTELGTELPEDAFHNDGIISFNTYSEVLTVTAGNLSSYREVAKSLAPKLVAKAKESHGCVFAKGDNACIDDFVKDFGERAYRRPLTSTELTKYRELFASSTMSWTADVGASQVIKAMLLSPWHLYRTEFGEKADNGRVQLTQSEIANEISFLITDGPADAELQKAAAVGDLHKADVRKAHVERLLNTAEGKGKTLELFSQLYGVNDVLTIGKSAAVFPDFTVKIREDMRNESKALIEASLSDESKGLVALFSATESKMSGRLARYYGLTSTAKDDEISTMKLPASRKGLLGLGAFAAVSSASDHTSTSKRGLYVFTRLLCSTVPTPPEGAASKANGKIFAPNMDYTQREHWDYALKTAPECTGCHGQFIPYGLGFEQFDAVGRDRPKEFGKTIDPKVSVKDVSSEIDGDYASSAEMVSKLIATETGSACFARHARGFLFGAAPGDADSCRNKALGKSLKSSGGNVRALLVQMVTNPSFVLRKAGN